jgi:hypothetical protein
LGVVFKVYKVTKVTRVTKVTPPEGSVFSRIVIKVCEYLKLRVNCEQSYEIAIPLGEGHVFARSVLEGKE